MYGFAASTLIGVCMGFLFGVGCALAVMYSIFMGGYRAALDDLRLPEAPRRLNEQRSKMDRSHLKRSVRA